MPPVSPTVSRWEVTARVRQRRDELSITGPTLAKELGFTSTYWSKVENEQRVLPAEKFTRLLEFLEFPGDERQELLDLRAASSQSGWWSQYSKVFNSAQLNLWGLEAGAEEIRSYESLLIPGLLQTEEYMRALIEADSIAIPVKEIQRRVTTRVRRQERVFGNDPVRFVAVISQAAVEQQFGGPSVLRRQLEHLVTAVREHPDTIDVRIVPFTSRTGVILGGCTFHTLDFPSPRMAPLAWFESPVVSGIIDDPDKVSDLSRSFQRAQEQALNPADSLALIEESAGKLESVDE